MDGLRSLLGLKLEVPLNAMKAIEDCKEIMFREYDYKPEFIYETMTKIKPSILSIHT